MTTFIIPAPSIEERVSYGASMLDEHAPGWMDKIDPMGLDVSKAGECVLGQLFGCFNKGAAYFYGEAQLYRAANHGFDILAGDDAEDEECSAEFEALTGAWLDLLEARAV